MSLLTTLKGKAKKLKAEAQVLIIAYKDKRTPTAAKILIGITIGYLLSPIDLIPDFIPVLGLLDDLLIVPFLIWVSLRLIPGEVIMNARIKAQEEPLHLKKTNWIFAGVVILIWIASIVFLLHFFFIDKHKK